jgi:hypothetical protein
MHTPDPENQRAHQLPAYCLWLFCCWLVPWWQITPQVFCCLTCCKAKFEGIAPFGDTETCLQLQWHFQGHYCQNHFWSYMEGGFRSQNLTMRNVLYVQNNFCSCLHSWYPMLNAWQSSEASTWKVKNWTCQQYPPPPTSFLNFNPFAQCNEDFCDLRGTRCH